MFSVILQTPEDVFPGQLHAPMQGPFASFFSIRQYITIMGQLLSISLMQ